MTTDEITLPLDQSLRVSTLSNRYIILSVSDTGLVLGKPPFDNFTIFTSGAYIYSEGLGLASSVGSQHGLSISANMIVSPRQISISTKGASGEKQSDTTKKVESGKPAGSLNFYLQSGTDENAKNISLDATGGNGGDTIVSGGRGGDGGNGGKIVHIFQSQYDTLFKLVTTFLKRDDVTSRDQKSNVINGDTVYTAAHGLSLYPTRDMLSIDEWMEKVRDRLSNIEKGQSCTLQQLTVDIKRVRNHLVKGRDDQNRWFQPHADFKGGSPGSGDGVTATTGDFGKNGEVLSLLLPGHDDKYLPLDDAAALRKMPFAFAHPDQCGMLLTRAKVFYYMGSPTLRNVAKQTLRRILDRLSFLPLKEDDPLYKAYADSPVMPSGWLKALNGIHTDANTQLLHLASGLDYNGYTAMFVPRQSYTSYKGILDTALKDYKEFEDAYISYHTALSKQEELQDAIGRALRNTDSMIKSIKLDMKDLVDKLYDADYQIKLLSQPVLDTQKSLIDEYDLVKDKVKDSFKLSVPQIVNALTLIAFIPNKGMIGNKGMIALQIANLIYQGASSVPGDDDVTVNKNVIIGKLKAGEASVKGIKTTLSKDKLDGTFQLDDPNGTRLLAIEDEMMNFLSNYSKSCFAEVINELKTKFDDFVNAVVARNAWVLQYNIVLKMLVQKAADKKDYEAKRDDLRKRVVIKASDPDLPEITRYMCSIYQSSRSRALKIINLLVRALNFRMLEENDIYGIAFDQFGGEDQVPLTVTSTVMRNARSLVESRFSNAVEKWGSEPSKFPPDWGDWRATGKRIHLASADVNILKDPKTNYSVDLDYSTLFRQTTPKTDFVGCCNVRVYRVRFRVVGLKLGPLAKEAHVRVKIKHKGEENFVDKKNAEHRYIHDAIDIVYSYILKSDGTFAEVDDGNIVEADVHKQATSYAAPGPFAKWTVSLNDSDLNRLDFSEAKGAYFDFFGTNYSLA